MEQKKKFILEFDEEPAFVYVCEEPRKEHIWTQGHKVEGWTSLELTTDMESFPEYKLTGFAHVKQQKCVGCGVRFTRTKDDFLYCKDC